MTRGLIAARVPRLIVVVGKVTACRLRPWRLRYRSPTSRPIETTLC
uniref:Uncharacterized protein n=1 Tax=Rhizophora mucronata TaxID=61149 RepID=A0A2P2R1H8_RHIMU